MGWFTTMDPALLIANTDRGDQIDLLVVPPHTAATAAAQAMTTAADPTNVLRAPAILAAGAGARATAGNDHDTDSDAVWDNEGGAATMANMRHDHPSRESSPWGSYASSGPTGDGLDIHPLPARAG
jgi:hypothetical protein